MASATSCVLAFIVITIVSIEYDIDNDQSAIKVHVFPGDDVFVQCNGSIDLTNTGLKNRWAIVGNPHVVSSMYVSTVRTPECVIHYLYVVNFTESRIGVLYMERDIVLCMFDISTYDIDSVIYAYYGWWIGVGVALFISICLLISAIWYYVKRYRATYMSKKLCHAMDTSLTVQDSSII